MSVPRLHPSEITIPKLKFDVLSRNKGKNSETNVHTARFASIDCLSYTFRAFHAKVQRNHQDRNQYTSDLEKTLELNFQIVNSFIPSLILKREEKSKLIEAINLIQQCHEKKKKLMKGKDSIRSKVLVDLQINEEAKRRKEEMNDYQVEKKEEQKAAVEKKTISMKRFQKKFNEVEAYIQRESQSSAKYKNKFAEYELLTFLCVNENLMAKSNMLYQDLKIINNDIRIIRKENKELQDRGEYQGRKDQGKTKEMEKYQDMLLSLTSKNRHYEAINHKLKQMIREINNQIKLKTIEKSLIEEQSQINPITINADIGQDDKDDLSLFNITNVKFTEENVNEGEILDTLNKGNQAKWDISCIEKTDQ